MQGNHGHMFTSTVCCKRHAKSCLTAVTSSCLFKSRVTCNLLTTLYKQFLSRFMYTNPLLERFKSGGCGSFDSPIYFSFHLVNVGSAKPLLMRVYISSPRNVQHRQTKKPAHDPYRRMTPWNPLERQQLSDMNF